MEEPKVKTNSTSTLIAQIANLTRENEALKSESKKHRIAKRDVGEEAAQLRQELDKASKQLDHYKKQVESTPDELRQELESYRSELRMTRHRDAFTKVAKELGIRDEAVNDAFALSGYKPKGDEVDAEHLRSVVNETLVGRSYLKGETQKPKLTAGPGASRGSTSRSGFAPTQEQLQDPVWLYYNQNKVGEAINSGNFVNPYE